MRVAGSACQAVAAAGLHGSVAQIRRAGAGAAAVDAGPSGAEAALELAWQAFARRFAAATDADELVRFGLETEHLRGEIPWPFARQVVDALQREAPDVGLLARADGRAVRLVLQLLYQAGQGWRAQLAAMWRGSPALIGE